MLAFKTIDPNTGHFDIYIASAVTAGSASAIASTDTASIFGSPFTADSSHVLYVDNISNGAGDYHAAPTSGGAGVLVTTSLWIGLATSASKVVLTDAFIPNVGLQGQGVANIESVDVSASPTPTLLVNQTDPNLFFSSNGSAIVYSLTLCSSGARASG